MLVHAGPRRSGMKGRNVQFERRSYAMTNNASSTGSSVSACPGSADRDVAALARRRFDFGGCSAAIWAEENCRGDLVVALLWLLLYRRAWRWRVGDDVDGGVEG